MREQRDDVTRVAEDIALHFEAAGLPPMAGRILGRLLVCHPPEQSSAQLQEALSASKGSISMSTALLARMGLIERTRVPGDRKHYYLIRPGVWSRLMADQVEQVRRIRQTVEDGLKALGDAGPARRNRLEEMHAFYAFYERELPALVERWQRSREPKVA